MLEIRLRAARPARRPASRLARQASAGAAREHSGGGRAARAVHLRHPDRHRRDAQRSASTSLLALRDLNDAHGHIQEIIIQNFRPKPGTRMADAPAPSLDEHLWTIAIARLLFAPAMNIQAPPNLSPGALRRLIEAGINDWGGVSPVTPGSRQSGGAVAASQGARARHQRRPASSWSNGWRSIRPYARAADAWVDPALRTALLHRLDADGWPRTDDWSPGALAPLPEIAAPAVRPVPAGRGCDGSGERVRPDARSTRPTSSGCSARAAMNSRRCARRPTKCGRPSTATSSPTSSPAISTTPTSAISNASSAPSRKAR